MKKWLENIGYGLEMVLFYPLSLLPFRVLYLLSDLTFFIIYYCTRYRKKVVRANLSSSFPEKSKSELRAIERRFYAFLCDYFFETIKVLSISDKEMKRRMTFGGIDEVLKQLNGRSCVLYMGHYCNWEWVTSLRLHVPQSYHLGQIYHPLKDKATDRFFLKLRGHFHSESIPMVDTLRRIVSLRNEGTPFMIGFIADQTPSWANIRYWLPFLNHDTPVFIGTERIAHQTKSPAYYAAMTRPKRGYYHCEFVLLHDEPQTLPEHQLTDRYFKALEQSIQEEPAYRLWSHRRWKRQRQQPPTAS